MKANRLLMSWLLFPLIVGVCVSGITAVQMEKFNRQKIQQAVSEEANRLADKVVARIGLYVYGLRGARGAVLTVGEANISRALFRRYSLSRDIDKEFPGARGFGFIRRISPEQEADFLIKARLDDKPDFTIRQLSAHAGDRYVIQYIEPVERNLAAIGLDIASEYHRLVAAELSMRTGAAAITGPITLVQVTGAPAQSFLIFLPIYRSVATPMTVAEREAQLLGWSYVPLLMKDVLANISLDTESSELEVSDISKSDSREVFFSNKKTTTPVLLTHTIEREVMGRRWQFELGFYDIFIQQLHLRSPKLAFLLGVFLSLLIAALAGALGISHNRKRAIVLEQARLAAIVASSIDGIISKDSTGIVTSWNFGAEIIFGYTAQEAIGKSLASLIVPPELQHEEVEIVARINKGEYIPHFTTTRLRHDGSTVAVSIAIAPIRNAEQQIIGASKTVRDITEQKASEDKILELNLNLEEKILQRTRQLELSTRSLQTILDAVPSMIGYWDKQLINRVANRAYYDWFGIEHTKIPGLHVSELFGEQLYKSNREFIEAALRGEKQTFHQSITTPKGVKHAFVHYLPDFDNGEVQGYYVIVHDISDVTEANAQLQKALRENKALLSTINQQFMFSVTDIRGNIIEINEKFLTSSGYSHEEIIGKNHRILNSGRHDPAFWRELWTVIASGESWHGEICNRAKNGTLSWFDTVIAPFLSVDGKVERYIALRTDISERKRAESERAKLNFLITNVLNAATEIAVIATDTEGTITIFNRGAELMLGYTADELVGKATPAIFHLMDEVIARGQELTEEFGIPIVGFRAFVYKSEIDGAETRTWTYIRKDGSRLQVSLAVTTLRDSNGKITGYLGMATDVTQELEAKRNLQSSIYQLDIAADIAELGIWTWHLGDNSLGWSDRMFQIYDQPLSLRNNGLNYQHWYERLHPDDAVAAAAWITAVVEGHGVVDHTFRIVTQAGRVRYIQGGAQIERNSFNEVTKVTGINRDITPQKELEAALIKAKESADASSASKSAFLANMSHEIRTPMNAVLGMLQLVQQTELTLRQREYITKSQTAAKSLLGLLNDILDFSKIDSGKLQLEWHPFELDPLIRDLAVILSGNQGDKNVEIIFDIDPYLPQLLLGDRLRLQQILINLAGNALKFTLQGQIVVSLQLLENEAQNIRIRFAVSDTGIGISAEQIDRIFEGFAQAEASTTRRFGGTGLGLVISKRLVELMNGELIVESEPGRGSRFWFDIGFKVSDQKQELPQGMQRNLAGLHILVVDDNRSSREVLLQMVTALGAKAEGADGGLAALQKIRNGGTTHSGYDLALMDWRMPDLDGLSVAELIRLAPNDKQTLVVIMVTAFEREELIASQNSTPAPYVGLLTKPVTPNQLAEAILNAVAGTSVNLQQATLPQLSQQPLAGLRILVVEDNALNREVAFELLTGEGAIIELAENGLEGVNKVLTEGQFFDLVIMDVQMPDIDGMEATRRIRADVNFTTLPILAMTANVSAADRAACLGAGMNDHVGKPIDMDELVPHILKLINKHGASRAQKTPGISADRSENLTDDFSEILKRFAGKADLYARTLVKFHPDTAKLLETIQVENLQKNSAAVVAALHSIKGIAGTMGAKALALKAAELEKQIKSPDSSPENKLLSQETLSKLKMLLDESSTKLKQRLDEYGQPLTLVADAIAVLSVTEWESQLADILPLLESDNLNAIDAVEKLYRNSRPSHQALLSQLVAQVNGLQYDLAIITINSILVGELKNGDAK